MKKVQILLSTYNGEKYLEDQLQSILSQDYPDITILIRDDGSTDNTIDIIKKYLLLDSRISYYHGTNIGARNSFFDLMKNSDPTMDYYSLSDQDDVWKPNKISSAIKKILNDDNTPVLYCSSTTLVNENLKSIINTIRKPHIDPGFGNALVENICSGCTCLFNAKLMDIIKKSIPEFTVMHDWWLYLCANAFGNVIYDENSYILYRQHAGNSVGSRSNYLDEFKKRYKDYKINRGQLIRQAKEFNRLFYNLDIEKVKLINLIMNSNSQVSSRLNIVFSNKIYRQRKLDNFIFKALFLLGIM